MNYCFGAILTFLLAFSFTGTNCLLVIWPNGPTLVNAFVGTNLTLGISYSGVTGPLVTWLNGTLILASWTIGLNTPPDIGQAYQNVLSIDQTGSLVFQNVPVSYSGTYIAQMAKPGSHEVSVNFTLSVYNVITYASIVTVSQYIVEGGAPFTLSYSSMQGPVMTSAWYFKSVALVNSSRYLITQNSLIINQPNRNDTGLYSVVLKNPFSNVMQSKNITVLYGPDKPVLEVSPSKATFVSGETISLSCRAEGEPPPSASWVFLGQTLPTSNGTLQLTHVHTSQSGIYTCVLVNSMTSKSLARNITINILGLSSSAIAGIAAGVPCLILLLLLFAGLIFSCYYCYKKKANKNPRYPVTKAVKKAVINQPDLIKPHKLLTRSLKQPPPYNYQPHQVSSERPGSLPLGVPPVRMATTV
ncbi:carcinoembryonic antigen-related cell adhesion molecule 6 isoform X2 [Silurus meridionalis]|uniref:carcinoembryonic antigen-related cell adhesion molecule 6 isoform X2 n=1 Tax=Silurus meridionalis TaxID=175797 RepID=UPI001EE9F57E|nr:carcinoembryonic antigen-related cell adhesion molecule 6 isoform X2 [Silurus meridionalis]